MSVRRRNPVEEREQRMCTSNGGKKRNNPARGKKKGMPGTPWLSSTASCGGLVSPACVRLAVPDARLLSAHYFMVAQLFCADRPKRLRALGILYKIHSRALGVRGRWRAGTEARELKNRHCDLVAALRDGSRHASTPTAHWPRLRSLLQCTCSPVPHVACYCRMPRLRARVETRWLRPENVLLAVAPMVMSLARH